MINQWLAIFFYFATEPHQNYGYIDLLIKSQELEYLKSLFLTFGKDVKIKSPIQLRNMLVKELKSTLKVYES